MVNLVKGQKVDLTKGRSGLNKVLFGLGWNVNRYDGESPFDLDVSAFLLSDGKVTEEKNFVFYGNQSDSSGSVVYSGDNRTGEGNGDDETIHVELSKIPANVDRIAFAVTIYDAQQRCQNFGMVSGSYIRAVDEDSGEELFKYELEEDFSVETGIVAGELYRHGSEWKFSAVGSGFAGGLTALCGGYGMDV